MATMWRSGDEEIGEIPGQVRLLPSSPLSPGRRKGKGRERTPGPSHPRAYSPLVTPGSPFPALPRPSLPASPNKVDILRIDTPRKPQNKMARNTDDFIASLPLANPPKAERDDKAVKDVVNRYLRKAKYDGSPVTPNLPRLCKCCKNINEFNRKHKPERLPPRYFQLAPNPYPPNPLPPHTVRPYGTDPKRLFRAMISGDASKFSRSPRLGYRKSPPGTPGLDRDRLLPALMSPRVGMATPTKNGDMILYGPIKDPSKDPEMRSDTRYLNPLDRKPRKQYVTDNTQPELFYAAAGEGPIGMDPQSTALAQSVVEASARYLDCMNKLRGMSQTYG